MNETTMVGMHHLDNRGGLPPDLSAWLAKPVLALLVLQAVQNGVDRVPRQPGPGAAPLTSRARTLLTLLTYCHAIGIGPALDIARSIEEDDTVASLSAGTRPTIGEIARYRRSCHELLQACLQKVCLVTWKLRFGQWPESVGSGSQVEPAAPGRRIDASFLLQIACEVEQRLRLAEAGDGIGREVATAA
jgi:hypothetical protein